MKNKNRPRLILIEWLDSGQPIPGWKFLDDLPPLEVINCLSVGWLVAENKDVKMLAPNLGDVNSEDNTQASGFIRIPTAAIVREVRLKENF